MPRLRCAKTSSAVRSFIQVATRSHSTVAAPLDFLLPRCASPTVTTEALPKTRAHVRSAPALQKSDFPIPLPSKRHFTTSSARQLTRSILNTLKDEDGKEMMLEITPRAAKRLSQIMEKDTNPNLALRIQVESGGCHGFQYLMSLITLPAKDSAEWSSTINEDDTIFQYLSDDADPTTTSEDGPKIILDEASLDLLKGSKVDFTMELIGSQFKIVDNPYATSSCGCGTSFDIKM